MGDSVFWAEKWASPEPRRLQSDASRSLHVPSGISARIHFCVLIRALVFLICIFLKLQRFRPGFQVTKAEDFW
jgi:hypothetical protein